MSQFVCKLRMERKSKFYVINNCFGSHPLIEKGAKKVIESAV